MIEAARVVLDTNVVVSGILFPGSMPARALGKAQGATVLSSISNPIHVCRDPRDDKFLEAAVHGGADLIVTGDRDLLALDPFERIRIVTPVAFLEE